MAKKVNAQRVEARRLFEEDGLSLKEIAEELGIKQNTLKTWKRRDGWVKNEPRNETEPKKDSKNKIRNKDSEVSKRGSNPNSQKNLVPAKSGEQRSLKHGLFSKYLNPQAREIYEELADLNNIDSLNQSIQIKLANYAAAQNTQEYDNPKLLDADSKALNAITTSISNYENLSLINERRRQLELDNALKEKGLKQLEAEEAGRNLTPYRGLPIDVVAPVFAQLHHDVRDRNYREFVLPGGRGSTKSSFISLEIINLIEQNPTYHALVCRQIDKDLRRSVFNQLLWAIDKLDLREEYKTTYSPLEITKISTGQKIYFTGLSDPTSVKSFTPTFGYVGILWFEELDQIRGDETVRKVQQSIVRGGEDFFIFKSFNPPRSKNNWANLYINQPKESMRVYPSTYLDVPRDWLGDPFLEEAEFLKQTNPDAYDNEYMGIANGSGGNVFPNLVAREITDEEIARFDSVDSGLDFGWVHPTAFIRCQYYSAYARLYVFDEAGGSYIPNKEMAEMIKEHGIKDDYVTADSEDPRSINELNNYGINAIKAKKGPNSRNHGYKWLAGLKEIIVDPVRCPNFYKQAINLEYERDKEGNITSLIPKIDDDWPDALRYAVEKYSRRNYDPFD